MALSIPEPCPLRFEDVVHAYSVPLRLQTGWERPDGTRRHTSAPVPWLCSQQRQTECMSAARLHAWWRIVASFSAHRYTQSRFWNSMTVIMAGFLVSRERNMRTDRGRIPASCILLHVYAGSLSVPVESIRGPLCRLSAAALVGPRHPGWRTVADTPCPAGAGFRVDTTLNQARHTTCRAL